MIDEQRKCWLYNTAHLTIDQLVGRQEERDKNISSVSITDCRLSKVCAEKKRERLEESADEWCPSAVCVLQSLDGWMDG